MNKNIHKCTPTLSKKAKLHSIGFSDHLAVFRSPCLVAYRMSLCIGWDNTLCIPQIIILNLNVLYI